MGRVIVVGCSELTARLPEALAGHGLELVAVGGAVSPFRRSRFIDRFVPLAGPPSLETWITTLLGEPSLAAGPDDWIVHAEDGLPCALARLDRPVECRLALLPLRRARGLAMVGSKAGLARLLQEQAIPTPPSQVAATPAELPSALEGFGGPLMVKADQGGGGKQVRRVPDPTAVLADPPPPGWYPLVLQAWVAGEGLAADALFRDGELVGLQTAWTLSATMGFGPGLSRRFLPGAPAGVISTLRALGRAAGLHGFFNCSLLLPVDGSAPLLFEADPRPNAWCAFGPRLGLDWGALMTTASPPTRPCLPGRVPPEGLEVHLFPREPEHALLTLSWGAARPWLLARPGTWDLRLREDEAIEAWEWQRLRRTLTPRLLALPLRRLAARLPAPLRRWALQRGLDRALLRRLGF
jgi:hypothetical protein